MREVDEKLERLRSILKGMERVVIAYSGGVDSTFLTKVATELLGDNAIAVTATSATYPEWEFREAKDIAAQFGFNHRIINSEELEIEGFSDNPPNRCYYCKGELFGKLLEIAREEGAKYVLDGTNADDLGDFRPGRQAAEELGVRSPLMEAEMSKDDIRLLSKEMGLPTWNKPSFACLSSRFPYGEKISWEKLQKVAKAEEYLRELGIGQLRVRHHDSIARIEVLPSDFPRLCRDEVRGQILRKFKELGYAYVTLDLAGYRTGSMNEVLAIEKNS
ncbi:MAG: ATP-dependent sacrificial sulfur transferase LarE [bacterium]